MSAIRQSVALARMIFLSITFGMLAEALALALALAVATGIYNREGDSR